MARLNAKWYNFSRRGQKWYHFWQDSPASGSTTYTYVPSGGIALSGIAVTSKAKVAVPTGGITLSGSAVLAKKKSPICLGGTVLSGSGSYGFVPFQPANQQGSSQQAQYSRRARMQRIIASRGGL